MKHFFLAASLAAAVTGVSAQVAQTPASQPNVPFPARIVPNESVMPVQTGKADGETQALSYRTVWAPTYPSNFMYHARAVHDNVLHYDVKTGTIMTLRTEPTFSGDQLSSGSLSLMISTNKGQTWTQRPLQTGSPYFIGIPQFSVIAPEGATSLDDYYFYVYGLKYMAPSGTATTGAFVVITPGNDPYDIEFDLQGNLSGYRFWTGSDIVGDPNAMVVHQVDMLGAISGSQVQYGAYGVSSFSLVDEDWRFVGQPTELALNKFRPGQSPSNSYNTPIYTDVDTDGNAYIATNNFLAGNTEDREIQVFKSTNEGTTWSAPNVMPASIFDEYAASIGANVIYQPGLTPYYGSEFVVTGADEYSFFTRVLAGTVDPGNPSQLQSIISYAILECKYKSNAWSVSKVAELNTIAPYQFSLQDSLTRELGQNIFVRFENERGAEIQAARSGDGKLVIKYIDIDTNRIITWSPPYRLMTFSNGLWIEDGSIDTLVSTDVFISVRDINGSTWSAPVNVTNDNEYNNRTYIPRDIANTNEIPFLQAIGNPAASLNPQFAQALLATGTTARFAMINMSTVSVNEEPVSASFHVADVRPNPSTSNAEVVFTLDRPATVSVDVFDVMGNLISTVIPSTRMDAAVNGTNIDVSNFAPGTYMVTVTVDGVRSARKFTVVK